MSSLLYDFLTVITSVVSSFSIISSNHIFDNKER